MKILIIPDSFKGCLSAKQVANAIEKGILDIYPNLKVDKFPFSDGGEDRYFSFKEFRFFNYS